MHGECVSHCGYPSRSRSQPGRCQAPDGASHISPLVSAAWANSWLMAAASDSTRGQCVGKVGHIYLLHPLPSICATGTSACFTNSSKRQCKVVTGPLSCAENHSFLLHMWLLHDGHSKQGNHNAIIAPAVKKRPEACGSFADDDARI